MGALGKLFSTLFGRFFQFFGAYASGKLLLSAAGVTAFLLMLTGLIQIFSGALVLLEKTVPPEYDFALGLIPQNVPLCITTLLSFKAAMWVVQVKWSIIKVKLQG